MSDNCCWAWEKGDRIFMVEETKILLLGYGMGEIGMELGMKSIDGRERRRKRWKRWKRWQSER